MPDGTNIGKAYLQVVPVAKGIQGSLTSVLNGEAGSAGESAGKSIASKIKSTIVASGIGLAIGNIIKQVITTSILFSQSCFFLLKKYATSNDIPIKGK